MSGPPFRSCHPAEASDPGNISLSTPSSRRPPGSSVGMVGIPLGSTELGGGGLSPPSAALSPNSSAPVMSSLMPLSGMTPPLDSISVGGAEHTHMREHPEWRSYNLWSADHVRGAFGRQSSLRAPALDGASRSMRLAGSGAHVAPPAKQMMLQRLQHSHLDHQHHGDLDNGPSKNLIGLDQVGGLPQAVADAA
jgi:hypothetical protein